MKVAVYYMNIIAGILEKQPSGFSFEYTDQYLQSNYPAISFSFPKSKNPFFLKYLFPFFSGLLSEGTNKDIQCRALQIDERDEFMRLIKTANTETIGAITVREI